VNWIKPRLPPISAKKLNALRDNQTETDIKSAHHLIQAGKKVGSISSTAKHITVKLSAHAISPEQEQQLKVFLEQLLDGQAEKV